jgi:hypothetical protein
LGIALAEAKISVNRWQDLVASGSVSEQETDQYIGHWNL